VLLLIVKVNCTQIIFLFLTWGFYWEETTEMARLKREVNRLEEENAFLKKWRSTSRKNRSEVRNDKEK